MATFESSLKSKLIYVFAINDDRHNDCLKIGETTIDEDDGSDLFNNAMALQEAAHKRIRQYTKTAGIAYQLLYTEISIFVRSGMIMTFNDKQVHKVLERSGIKRKEFEGVSGADELLQSRKVRQVFILQTSPKDKRPLSFVQNNKRLLIRLASVSRRATKCFGMPRCDSARHSLPFKS